jgi:hypothetical protein
VLPGTCAPTVRSLGGQRRPSVRVPWPASLAASASFYEDCLVGQTADLARSTPPERRKTMQRTRMFLAGRSLKRFAPAFLAITILFGCASLQASPRSASAL